LKADMDKRDLTPNEFLELALTDDDKEKYGITNRRTIARFLQKYIKDNKLKYTVKSFRREDKDFFIVAKPPR
jgi:hypothetical protein